MARACLRKRGGLMRVGTCACFFLQTFRDFDHIAALSEAAQKQLAQ